MDSHMRKKLEEVGGLTALGAFVVAGLFLMHSYTEKEADTYKKSAEAEVAALDSWLIGFSLPQDSPALDPPSRLSGEYLVWVTGSNKEDANNAYHGSEDILGDAAFPVHGGLLFGNPFLKGSDYQRHDSAGYVLVVRTYAEYKDTTAVTISTNSPVGGLGASDGTLTEPACSVIATLVDRNNKAIVARRDFPHPSNWVSGGGIVKDDKLSEVRSWLNGLGLHESDWVQRSNE